MSKAGKAGISKAQKPLYKLKKGESILSAPKNSIKKQPKKNWLERLFS